LWLNPNCKLKSEEDANHQIQKVATAGLEFGSEPYWNVTSDLPDKFAACLSSASSFSFASTPCGIYVFDLVAAAQDRRTSPGKVLLAPSRVDSADASCTEEA